VGFGGPGTVLALGGVGFPAGGATKRFPARPKLKFVREPATGKDRAGGFCSFQPVMSGTRARFRRAGGPPGGRDRGGRGGWRGRAEAVDVKGSPVSEM